MRNPFMGELLPWSTLKINGFAGEIRASGGFENGYFFKGKLSAIESCAISGRTELVGKKEHYKISKSNESSLKSLISNF